MPPREDHLSDRHVWRQIWAAVAVLVIAGIWLAWRWMGSNPPRWALFAIPAAALTVLYVVGRILFLRSRR